VKFVRGGERHSLRSVDAYIYRPIRVSPDRRNTLRLDGDTLLLRDDLRFTIWVIDDVGIRKAQRRMQALASHVFKLSTSLRESNIIGSEVRSNIGSEVRFSTQTYWPLQDFSKTLVNHQAGIAWQRVEKKNSNALPRGPLILLCRFFIVLNAVRTPHVGARAQVAVCVCVCVCVCTYIGVCVCVSE